MVDRGGSRDRRRWFQGISGTRGWWSLPGETDRMHTLSPRSGESVCIRSGSNGCDRQKRVSDFSGHFETSAVVGSPKA